MNTIFECLYMFFGSERGHQLSTYATGGGWGGSFKMRTAAYRCWRGFTSQVYVRTYIISFHVFGSILRNLL